LHNGGGTGGEKYRAPRFWQLPAQPLASQPISLRPRRRPPLPNFLDIDFDRGDGFLPAGLAAFTPKIFARIGMAWAPLVSPLPLVFCFRKVLSLLSED
jgi:hypothetical protein